MIGRLYSVVLDCANPEELAEFYCKLLGLEVTRVDDRWIDIGDERTGRISFQHAPDHVPPRWPDPAFPQQFHLDIEVDDIEEAEPKVLALGATHLSTPEQVDWTFRVYADPAGHPFCLVWD